MIIAILVAALAANGLAIATDYGMILHRLYKRIPKALRPPLGGCVACTAGSTMTILACIGFGIYSPIDVVLVSLASVAVGELVYNQYT